MSYKLDMEKAQSPMLEINKKGKKATLVHYNEYDDKYYEITEVIGIVTKIKERGEKGQISRIEVMFAQNKIAETAIFIDKYVVEGSIISLLGYFIDYGEYGLKFSAKGGSCIFRNNLKDLYVDQNINVLRVYKTGICLGLSKVEMPKTYTRNSNIKKIEGLPNFYCVEEEYPIISEKQQDIINTALSKMNGRAKGNVGITCEQPVEDVPDFDDAAYYKNSIQNQVVQNQCPQNKEIIAPSIANEENALVKDVDSSIRQIEAIPNLPNETTSTNINNEQNSIIEDVDSNVEEQEEIISNEEKINELRALAEKANKAGETIREIWNSQKSDSQKSIDN